MEPKTSLSSFDQHRNTFDHRNTNSKIKQPPLSVKAKCGVNSFKRPNGSVSVKQMMIPMYVNVTGPGDYNIPGFTDKFANESNSNKRTAPSFTCAPKTK